MPSGSNSHSTLVRRAVRAAVASAMCAAGIVRAAPDLAPLSPAQQIVPGPEGSLFATAPMSVITAMVAITNTLPDPHVVGVEAAPGGTGPAWPVRVSPGRLLAPGAGASVPVTVEVPIGALDGVRTATRLTVRAALETDAPVTVTEQTLHAWTGGDMPRGDDERAGGYVGCRGDLDLDGYVAPYEADVVAERFAARRGEGNYDAAWDFDHDGRIGAADVQAVAGRVREHCGALLDIDSTALREAVTIEPIRAHLEALQAVADANGGNRAAGTPGYDASAAYMAGVLEEVGYRDVRRPFSFDVERVPAPARIEVLTPVAGTWTPVVDFLQAELSGGGDITAEVVPVDVTIPPAATSGSTSGCELADWDGFPRGAIALVQRGSCSFSQKISHATFTGASAVFLFNEGQPDRIEPFAIQLGPTVSAIPVFAVRYGRGEEVVRHVRSGATVRAHIVAEAAVATVQDDNIVAEWPGSQGDLVVMIGAHLDSVPNGPGINDDGSGAAAVVEIARQVARLGLRPRHTLRFALWGAEEIAGLGAQAYLDDLSPTDRFRILAYLNFDMIASMNPMRDVYPAQYAPDGSDEISALFGRWFTARRAPYEETTIIGGLDSDTFEWLGIPTGGLFTGHNMVMTAAQAARYQGVADAPMDPCYHRACDTIANIHWPILTEMAEAAAHATWSLANDDLLAVTSRRALPLPPATPVTVTAASAALWSVDPGVAGPAAADAADGRSAGGASPSASVAQRPDEVIALAVNATGMAAAEVTLSFDPRAVQVLGVDGGFLPPDGRMLGPVVLPGSMSFGVVGGTEGITGTGRIAHIRYHLLRGAGPPAFRIDAGATGMYDARGVRLPPPATVQLAGAAVTGVWLPWSGVGR